VPDCGHNPIGRRLVRPWQKGTRMRSALNPLPFVPTPILPGYVRIPNINMRKIWQNDFSVVGRPFFTPQKKQKNRERGVRGEGRGVRETGAERLDLQGFFARSRAAGVAGSAVWRRLINLWWNARLWIYLWCLGPFLGRICAKKSRERGVSSLVWPAPTYFAFGFGFARSPFPSDGWRKTSRGWRCRAG
jgi:hypothetical protein